MAVILIVIGCFVLPVTAAAQESAKTSYMIIDAQRTSTMEKELVAAASLQFRVLLASNTGGSAKVLLLEKSGAIDSKPSQYILLADSDTARLEQEMNGAAAQGFRLVPGSVIRNPGVVGKEGEEIVVVMEKLEGASTTRFQYQIVFCATDYTIKNGLLWPTIKGHLDNEAADVKLAGAVTVGFHAVSVLTRNVKEKTGIVGRQLRQELVVLFEKTQDAPHRIAPADAINRYHVMSAGGSEQDVEDMLNRAAAAGYHMLAASPLAFPEMVAVVERNPQGDVAYSYRVLASWRYLVQGSPRKTALEQELANLEQELANLAAGGWLPHPRGWLDRGWLDRSAGVEMVGSVLVTERMRGSAPDTSTEYRLLYSRRIATLTRELNGAAEAGFQVLNLGTDSGFLVVILKRKTATSVVYHGAVSRDRRLAVTRCASCGSR